MQLTQLFVALGLDTKKFTKEIKQAEGQMTSSFQGIGDAGQTVTGVGLAIGAGLGFAVKSAADFEQGMSNIKAVSGATGDEMAKLERLAMDMGAETKYSAKEAASGIEELIKAGLTTEQIMGGGLKGALSLATAGELELGEAAEIASTALNAFKADNLSVSDAANILAGAANASATDVRELKFGLASVSAVASSVGLSFEDTSTALAVFAQNGLKGSDAGTSLKTMLMNLQPKTDAQYAAFEKLGLMTKEGTSAFFDANGKLKSMAEISDLLKTSMTGMTDAQRLSTMETIFGSDAIRAANILYKEGATGINNMKSEMSKVTAEEVAKTKMDNLNGSIEQLKGSLETMVITMGDKLIPTVKSADDWLTGLTNKFIGLSPEVQSLIIYGAALTAGLFLIGGPILMLIGFIPSIMGGLAMLGTAFTAVKTASLLAFGPMGLLIAGVVTAGILLYKNWDTVKAKMSAIFKGIGDALKGMVNVVIGGLNKMITGLNNAFSFSLPSWIPGVGGKSFRLNIPQIPMLAEGGIVTGPTLAMIGEAGAEAVVPLDKMDGMGGGPMIIIFELDGRQIAKTVSKYQGGRLRIQGAF